MMKYLIGNTLVMFTILTACSSAPVATAAALPTSAPVVTVKSTAQVTMTAAPSVPLVFPEIAFYGNRTGDNEIYVMNTDGSGQTNLTQNPANDTNPVWSPDHTRIAFTSDRDGNQEVYVMNADGSNAVNLTKNPAVDGFPSWSPDGEQIAFYTERGILADSNSEFYVNNAGGSALFGSPGMREISFHAGASANPNTAPTLYVINADGSGEASVLVSYQGDNVSWSPDEKQITFTTNFFGGNGEIWVINSDGNGLKRLAVQAGPAAWSPDGKWITFESYRDNIALPPKKEIYVMNTDGSNPVRLTHNEADDTNPTWSPDGKQIAFNSDRDGSQQIYVMNADGSGQINLSNAKGYNYSPAWSSK